MIAHTSVEAFHSLDPVTYIQPKEQEVLFVWHVWGEDASFSRQQISTLTGMPINCVCGRVNSLVKAGVLEERGDRVDPLTDKRQKLLWLAKGD